MTETNYKELIPELAKAYPVEFPSIVKACSDYIRSVAHARSAHILFEQQGDLEKALAKIPMVKEVGIDAFATGLTEAMFESRKQ